MVKAQAWRELCSGLDSSAQLISLGTEQVCFFWYSTDTPDTLLHPPGRHRLQDIANKQIKVPPFSSQAQKRKRKQMF